METNKKRLKRDYQQSHRPMGVFLIRNMSNDKVFVGVGLNLVGIMNRHKFELELGKHRNKRLQADWNEFGGDRFAFEILDQLNPRDDPHFDYRAELAFLENLYLEQLQPYDERGYNQRPQSREEKLRRIASKRSSRP